MRPPRWGNPEKFEEDLKISEKVKKKPKKEVLTLYETNIKPNLEIIGGMLRKGATNDDIIERFKISKQSFYTWRKKYKEFGEIVENNKEFANSVVEKSLFDLATGTFIYKEQAIKLKKAVYKEEQEQFVLEEVVEIHTIREEIPKNLGAIQTWLNNRDKENYSYKPAAVINNDDNPKHKALEAMTGIILKRFGDNK